MIDTDEHATKHREAGALRVGATSPEHDAAGWCHKFSAPVALNPAANVTITPCSGSRVRGPEVSCIVPDAWRQASRNTPRIAAAPAPNRKPAHHHHPDAMSTSPHILVATDFSRPAELALTRAATLAAAIGARLDVVHVKAPLPPALLRWLRRQPEGEATLGGAEAQLAHSVARARDRGAEARGHLLTGAPVPTLEAACRRFKSGLAVIGARGARGLRDQLLGTTAERMIERLPCDLLTVHKSTRGPYRRILACVDGSPASTRALTVSAALWPDAHIHALYAYEPPLESNFRGANLNAMLAEHRRSEQQRAERALADCLEAAGIPADRVTPTLGRGYTPQVIERAAKRLAPNMIAVGHHTSALVAPFLGSVARHVLRLNAGDVLIARP